MQKVPAIVPSVMPQNNLLPRRLSPEQILAYGRDGFNSGCDDQTRLAGSLAKSSSAANELRRSR